VDIVAELDGRPVAASQGQVLVTAFHPELTDDRRLHRRFAAMLAGREEAVA
jgi:5'-phosphate synthase pdxT subunit